MNKDFSILILLLILLVLLGCAAQSGWTPTIDTSSNESIKTDVTTTRPIPTYHKEVTHTKRPIRTVRVKKVYHRTKPRIIQAVNTYQPRRTYAQDLAECKMLAQQAAGYMPEETIKGGLIGGAIGAAAGAAIGAVLGHAGKGAAIGAAAGGIGGGAYKGLSTDQRYKQAYIRCMRNRGYKVLN